MAGLGEWLLSWIRWVGNWQV